MTHKIFCPAPNPPASRRGHRYHNFAIARGKQAIASTNRLNKHSTIKTTNTGTKPFKKRSWVLNVQFDSKNGSTCIAFMYSHQQNKWYPQRSLLAHFEATFYFNRSEFTTYYLLIIECSFEMGK